MYVRESFILDAAQCFRSANLKIRPDFVQMRDPLRKKAESAGDYHTARDIILGGKDMGHEW